MRGYEELRHAIGAYRLPRDVVAVGGPDAPAYLQGQLSQDVEPLVAGAAADALVLEPDGKLTALVRVTRTEDGYLLDTARGWGEAVLERLRRFRLRTKVELELREWACVALRGAGVAAGALGGPAPPWVLPVDWNGTSGADLLGPGAEERVPGGAVWCDDAAWEALRIEAGIPVMGRELDRRTIAAEAHLVARAVSLTKGCYTGQELVARLDARGSRVARRLCGVVADGFYPQAASELVGGSLWAGSERDRAAGRCTSASWCPGVGAVAGLAYVHRSVELPAVLVWEPESGDDAAGRELRALPLPLVAG